MNVLEQFGIVPIDFATLETVLSEYRYPRDKVSQMEKNGELIRLKKGVFVVSPNIHRMIISRELVANHLYGPSYISFENALAFYKLIPERVHTIRSMTLKRARKFSTPLGNFDYISAPKDYFQIGIRQEIVSDKYAYLIASPEKAICDMIISTPGLRLQSVKAMQIYLEEDLRIDFSAVEIFDNQIIRQCIDTGRKKTELTQLYKLLER
jgi:predicted transcriptional regulator of viral defense system